MKNNKTLLTIGAVSCLFVFFVSCTSKHRLGPKQSANWAYVPQTIEIHPLSRFRNPIQENEETMIVVHVEFNDGDGFACRGVGELRVTLYGKNNQSIGSEVVLLQDADENYKRFDPITRTYQVRFNAIPDDLEQVSAIATFTPIEENEMTSQKHMIQNNR